MQAEGPVLILAGAGSGKTRVITHRIAYLMQECGVRPYNILAITFTNKAAGEMRRRVDDLIGFGAESVWISTFHSLCVRILRRYIDRIGYELSFSIYDTDDQKRVMKEICKKLNIDPKFMREKAVLSVISSAKNAMKGPAQFRRDEAGTDFRMELIADCYDEYQNVLRKNNALDFDDLLLMTVRLFRDAPEVLENYRERFRYLMVDEYQDTNKVQFELVKMLSQKHRNLCVVGDDDQSIYKFRGADIRNILNFEKEFPDALVVRLEQNYRSSQTILDAANAVIRNNRQRKDKRLWSEKGQGETVRFRQFNTPQEEAVFIVNDLLQKKGRGVRYKDFAVLYRTNAQSRALEEQFVRASVPYNVVGGTNFYDRREIRDLLAYLKTIDNGRDEIAVKRILNVPRRGIGAATIDRLDAFALSDNLSFMEVITRSGEYPQLGRASAKLRSFSGLIDEFRNYAGTHLPHELIQEIIRKTEYEEELRRIDEEDAQDRMNNLQELIGKAVDYEEHAEEPSLTGFLQETALVADIDSVGEDDDRVLLMTLHSAKGLEFPHVYIAGMEEGLFPSRMSMDSEDKSAVEEERRLAYVGITRAMSTLTLTACRSRFQWGEITYSSVSRFISEIPEELFDRQPEYKKSYDYFPEESEKPAVSPAPGAQGRSRLKAVYVKPHTAESKKPYIARAGSGGAGRSAGASGALSGLQKGMPAAAAPDYAKGDRVEHIKFGEGTVKDIEPGPRDYKVTVMFDSCGQKIMYAGFAKLKKL